MEFFESPVFTKLIQKLINNEEYHLLQLQLSVRPESGDITKGSGGIHELRWAGSGRGKRGGIRVIYYYFTADEQIYMLYAYPKNLSSINKYGYRKSTLPRRDPRGRRGKGTQSVSGG